jgi:hypothetical protein
MSSGYYPKNSQVMQRSIEVARLVIPFVINTNATPANKVLGTDEASILFLQTQGVTQINSTSGALDPGEAAPPFDTTATDSTGAFNLLVNVAPGGQASSGPNGDTVIKIMHATITDRITGARYNCFMNSTNPAIDVNGDKMLLNCTSGVNLGTTTLNGCLEIEYTVNE